MIYNMEMTNEQKEMLKNDPLAKFLASSFGYDLNKVLSKPEKSENIEANKLTSNKTRLTNLVEQALENLKKEGKVESFKKDGETYYYVPEETREEEITPKMSSAQFVHLINSYDKLRQHIMCLEDTASQIEDTFTSVLQTLFGEEGLDVIDDFLDNPSKSDINTLYERLV